MVLRHLLEKREARKLRELAEAKYNEGFKLGFELGQKIGREIEQGYEQGIELGRQIEREEQNRRRAENKLNGEPED